MVEKNEKKLLKYPKNLNPKLLLFRTWCDKNKKNSINIAADLLKPKYGENVT